MSEEQAHKTLSDAGRKVLSEVLGESYLARRDATNNDFWGPVRAFSEEFAYASLWTRDGLDRKQRSMITIAMLCALNNGCTKTELREIFTHAIAYCGFPAAIDAQRVAEEVLKEQGKF